jgi:hypothetical protein
MMQFWAWDVHLTSMTFLAVVVLRAERPRLRRSGRGAHQFGDGGGDPPLSMRESGLLSWWRR